MHATTSGQASACLARSSPTWSRACFFSGLLSKDQVSVSLTGQQSSSNHVAVLYFGLIERLFASAILHDRAFLAFKQRIHIVVALHELSFEDDAVWGCLPHIGSKTGYPCYYNIYVYTMYKCMYVCGFRFGWQQCRVETLVTIGSCSTDFRRRIFTAKLPGPPTRTWYRLYHL